MTKFLTLFMAAALVLGGCSGGQSETAVETPAQTTQSTPQTNSQTQSEAQSQSNSQAESKKASTETQTASNDRPMDLLWEDLMPPGEEALLADMYTKYYEELEARIMAGQQTLSEAAKAQVDSGNFDINSIAEGAANDEMEQIGTFNVVSSLNNMKVRIPGYVVPLDFGATDGYKECLLVPYFGACLHTPPPPPNQIVFVRSKEGAKIENIQEPFWIEGVISTGEFTSDLGDTAYELDLTKLEKYDY